MTVEAALAFSNHMTRITPEAGVDFVFLANQLHFLWSRGYFKHRCVNHVNQASFSSTPLADTVPLLLPPASEQARISDALSELLSDLDMAVVTLKRVRAKLDLYRASVLKDAVEGRLTEDWRRKHPDVEPATALLERILVERKQRWEDAQLARYREKGQEPPKRWRARYPAPVNGPRPSSPSLPSHWVWASLDQLGLMDRGRSRHRPRDAAELYGGPYPFIQTGDVRRARQFVREHSQTYSERGLAQSRLWPADTLCITIAANIAETAILSYPACFPDSIVGMSFAPGLVSARFVELAARSMKATISESAPATAQKNINNEILRALSMPLPPFDEQCAIVDAVENQASVLDYLESAFEARLATATQLRHAILRHAFSGQLVPQDPADEPASALLARIAGVRAERDAQSGKAPRSKAIRKRRAPAAAPDQ